MSIDTSRNRQIVVEQISGAEYIGYFCSTRIVAIKAIEEFRRYILSNHLGVAVDKLPFDITPIWDEYYENDYFPGNEPPEDPMTWQEYVDHIIEQIVEDGAPQFVAVNKDRPRIIDCIPFELAHTMYVSLADFEETYKQK